MSECYYYGKQSDMHIDNLGNIVRVPSTYCPLIGSFCTTNGRWPMQGCFEAVQEIFRRHQAVAGWEPNQSKGPSSTPS